MRDMIALCGLKTGGERCDWGVIARQGHGERSLEALLAGEVFEAGARADRTRWVVSAASQGDWDAAYAYADAEMEAAARTGANLTTVLDDDYPINLRFVYNLPPFLFYRGRLDQDRDAVSVAVVGTRRPSEGGLERAEAMANTLCDHGVAVTSGLAAGIDTAAHRAAIAAGGRTIAVYGTGITRVYPAANAGLAEDIVDAGGLVVSQFFPTARAAKWTFRKRNEVTSGISQGTVVIEASATSGAKMQARLACEHGKRVFLPRSLISAQPWARDMAEHRQATPIGKVGDVPPLLVTADRLGEAVDVYRIPASTL